MNEAHLIEQMQGGFLVIFILCLFGFICGLFVSDKHQCHHRDCPHRPKDRIPLK